MMTVSLPGSSTTMMMPSSAREGMVCSRSTIRRMIGPGRLGYIGPDTQGQSHGDGQQAGRQHDEQVLEDQVPAHLPASFSQAPGCDLLLQQVNHRAEDDGQNGRRNGAQQDQGVVVGAGAPVDEVAQAAQTDHGGQHRPGDGVDGGHPQPGDDDGHGQGQLHPHQRLQGGHAAALGGLDVLALHLQNAGVGVFQHREHGVHAEGHDHGGIDVAPPDEQHADEHQAGDGLEDGEDRDDDAGEPPGDPGEQDAAPAGPPQSRWPRRPAHTRCARPMAVSSSAP